MKMEGTDMKAQTVKSLIKPMFRMPAKEDYLKAALRVARWLRADGGGHTLV